MKRRAALLTALVALTLAVWFVCAVIGEKAAPLIDDYAETLSHERAIAAMNEAVSEVIASSDVSYGDIVELEKDESGNVTAMKTNVALVNSYKTRICESVIDNIEKYNSDGAEIALGTIVGGTYLHGRGPKVRLMMVPLGTVSAEYVNNFSAAGINQTRCTISLHMTVALRVMLSGRTVETSASTDIPLAETVIVGSVPDKYTVVNGSSQASYNAIIDEN